MTISPHDTRQRAMEWVHKGALASRGVKFIAIVPPDADGSRQRLYSFEVPSYTWPADVELGKKDGAAGRWIWDEDLDRFTKKEEA